MRILEFISPSNVGGAENYVLNLSRKLREKGHEVFILLANSSVNKGSELSIHDFFKKGELSFETVNIGFKYNPIAIFKLIRFIKKNKIDIIHTHLSKANIIGGIAAKIADIKSVATVHGLNKKTQYKFSEFLICISEAVKKNLINQGIQEKSDITTIRKLTVIYNGIDTDKFNQGGEWLSKRQNKNNNPVFRLDKGGSEAFKCQYELNIGIIARLSKEKGVDLFLESARKALDNNKNLKFFIAGTGVMKNELINRAKQLKIEKFVYFFGFVKENLVQFINELDIVIIPSIKEGLSMVLLEAMSMRKTVIVSNVGGMPEVVENTKNGFIVEKGDTDAISRKINDIYENFAFIAESIGNNARKTVLERFSLDAMADKTEEFFKKIKN